MKKLAALLFLFAASPTLAAVLSWSPPPTDTNGVPFSISEQSTMTYRTYIGAAQYGPWTLDVTTGAGATSATVTEPQPGSTLWYTADVTYFTMTSEKAAAVSKTVNFPPPVLSIPNPPGAVVVR